MAKLICLNCGHEEKITKQFYNKYVSQSKKQKCFHCNNDMELTAGLFLEIKE